MKSNEQKFEKLEMIELKPINVYGLGYHHNLDNEDFPMQILPQVVISYAFSFLHPKEILVNLTIVCWLYYRCTSDNVIWKNFLQEPIGSNYKFIFANQPEKRVPKFVCISANGFNYFAEQTKNAIENKIKALKKEDKADFEFKGTKANLILTLSNQNVKRLLQLNVVTFEYIFVLNDRRRNNLCDKLFNKYLSSFLSKLERNRGNEKIRDQLRKKLKEVEDFSDSSNNHVKNYCEFKG